MYSVKGDVILDPFLGTGTTTAAAMTSARNSIGIEIDERFQSAINSVVCGILQFSNNYIHDRVDNHFEFVKNRIQNSKPLKYMNKYYNFPVMTSQEKDILLNTLKNVEVLEDNSFEVIYSLEPDTYDIAQTFIPNTDKKLESSKMQIGHDIFAV